MEKISVCIAIKEPNLKNFTKLILTPALFAVLIATTLVAEPNKVIFPPKHDPNESAHQKASILWPASLKVGIIIWIILEVVAALATFPIIEVKKAEIHEIPKTAKSKCPLVIAISLVLI